MNKINPFKLFLISITPILFLINFNIYSVLIFNQSLVNLQVLKLKDQNQKDIINLLMSNLCCYLME